MTSTFDPNQFKMDVHADRGFRKWFNTRYELVSNR